MPTPRRMQAVVSIHAPARGATGRLRFCLRQLIVSIHAPARGATDAPQRPAAREFSFNPRAREGRDFSDAAIQKRTFVFQSTRPRGARQRRETVLDGNRGVSIHAPARGATSASMQQPPITPVSIHAPARGATLKLTVPPQGDEVSIHAPARGATCPSASRRARI